MGIIEKNEKLGYWMKQLYNQTENLLSFKQKIVYHLQTGFVCRAVQILMNSCDQDIQNKIR